MNRSDGVRVVADATRLRAAVLLLACLLCSHFSATAASTNAAATTEEYRLEWAVKIKMRDGVDMNATVYRPLGSAPVATILSITPYISDVSHADAGYFAKRGFAYVVADVRGRGNSGGTYDPFSPQEADDGHDTVQWIASQPWSNGKIAMSGGSYSGHNQWTTAARSPPNLATIVPVASPFIGYDFPIRDNRLITFAVMWLMLTGGAADNVNTGSDIDYWYRALRRTYAENKPFAEFPQSAGMPSAIFDQWLKHPSWDDYWEQRNPSAAQFSKIDIPVLTVTGYYDGDQKGALEMYRRHLRAGQGHQDRHFLVIGPWGHAETRKPKREIGGYTFGEASVVDVNALDAAWYDWTMRGGSRPDFLKDRVAYFVSGPGADTWKYASSLETIATAAQTLYLDSSDGRAGDVFCCGVLATAAPSSGSKPDRYSYDPSRLPGLRGDMEQRFIVDQSDVLKIDGDAVLYTSAPFEEATEITGNVRLEAWLEMDVPDTDLNVVLYEIQADGSSVLLTSDAMRARYRNALSNATALKRGEIARFVFDRFDWFSRLVSPGSRLRLVISPPRTLDYELNFQTGSVVSRERVAEARKAVVKLHHSARYPSALTLPIVAQPTKSVLTGGR
jgi:uncharacterized protein